jgi:hypothetical protein
MNADLFIETETRVWPETVKVDWRRFSNGLWRVPAGDISGAYSADTMPKVTVFIHERCLFTNGGSCYSKSIMASVYAYPLLPVADYHALPGRRHSYEGKEVRFQGKTYRLGPKVTFTAIDPTVEEWRHHFRVLYADGGYFASQANYGQFLGDDSRHPQTPNGEQALSLERMGELLGHSKQVMQRLLAGETEHQPKLQLDLAF